MANDLIKLVPTIMSISLLESNLKKKKKGLLHQGIDNIVGASLIKETSDFTNF